MNREEMIKQLNAGKSPIEVAIQKWQDIVEGKGEDHGDSNCALCYTYKHQPLKSLCGDCPIAKVAGANCYYTPYMQQEKGWEQRELEFLKHLKDSPV